jgi:hypothetical protein
MGGMTRPERTHGDIALEAALASMEGANPRSAAIVLFFAAARHLGNTFDAPTAGSLAYMMADELATGGGK